MVHGDKQPEPPIPTIENVEGPNSTGETTAQSAVADNDSTAREEKARVLKRVEREMEFYRKGEYSRFQASTHVANELGKWAGASDKEKGKAFDSYLAEINSQIAIQDEERSDTRATSLPASSSNATRQQPNGKRIRDEVEELLDQVSGEALDGDVDGHQLGLE